LGIGLLFWESYMCNFSAIAASSRALLVVGATLASVALLAGPALADDRDDCSKAAGEEAISACSRLISAGNLGNFEALVYSAWLMSESRISTRQ
jgi:hypothetical protein